MEGQRLDKWLYCARLAKTRTGAARLIEDGKVRVNGVRVLKPSRIVHPGDVVTATPPGCLHVVRVAASAARRGAASFARTLYEDLTPQEKRASGHEKGGGQRKGARPTKRDRRRIDAVRGGA